MRVPKQPTQQSWKRLLFLHVTIASSFWGLRSFHQMLNKFKRRTPALLLREVAAYTHTCTHVRSHHSNLSSPNDCCVVFSVQPALLLKVIQKGIDYKRGLTLNSPPQKRGYKNKRLSVSMWIQPPYHFIKMTPGAFFSVITERVLHLAEQGFWRGVHLSDVF